MRSTASILLIIILCSCGGNDTSPDVTKYKVDLPVKRFEQDFFKTDTNNIAAGLIALNQKYPDFFPYFSGQVLHLPPPSLQVNDPQSDAAWKQIISGYKPVNDSIQKKYKDFSDIGNDLENAYAYVKYYYPSYSVPQAITTFIGTFDAPGVILTPKYLGVGLHQFAGKNFSIYQDPQLIEMYPQYISRRFDEEYIVAGSMKAVAADVYADSSVGRPMIEQMIEKGKQWYLVKHFLPKTDDSLITGFSKKQLEWTISNEGNIWGFITSNNDIYTIDPAIIQDFIGEGPFTRGMPETVSPGNIGQWVGWRIVQKFAEKNAKLSLQEVLTTPASVIFQQSKYKPK
jgi:hypothetical protein